MTCDPRRAGPKRKNDANTTAPPDANTTTARPELSWNSMPVVAGVPLELWIAIAALGLTGLWLLGVAIKSFVNFIQGYNKLITAALSIRPYPVAEASAAVRAAPW